MKNAELNYALALADKLGLREMGLTGSGTGYPEPDLGYFIYGFDNLEAARNFAATFDNCEVIKATWKNGWGFATNKGQYYPFDNNSPTLGYYMPDFADREAPEISTYIKCQAGYLSSYLAERAKELFDETGEIADFGYITDEIEGIDWETEFLVVNEFEMVAEKRALYGMVYEYDQKLTAIGVHIPLRIDD